AGGVAALPLERGGDAGPVAPCQPGDQPCRHPAVGELRDPAKRPVECGSGEWRPRVGRDPDRARLLHGSGQQCPNRGARQAISVSGTVSRYPSARSITVNATAGSTSTTSPSTCEGRRGRGRRRHGAGDEPESCLEQSTALVEHGYSITWSARSRNDFG